MVTSMILESKKRTIILSIVQYMVICLPDLLYGHHDHWRPGMRRNARLSRRQRRGSSCVRCLALQVRVIVIIKVKSLAGLEEKKVLQVQVTNMIIVTIIKKFCKFKSSTWWLTLSKCPSSAFHQIPPFYASSVKLLTQSWLSNDRRLDTESDIRRVRVDKYKRLSRVIC